MVHDTVASLLQVAPKLTDELDVLRLRQAEGLLKALPRQLSADDIRSLVSLFPNEGNTAFGLNWTILHAIEAAPDWPLWDALSDHSNEWVRILLMRLANAGIRPPLRVVK